MSTRSSALEVGVRTNLQNRLVESFADLPPKVLREVIFRSGIPKISELDDDQLVQLFGAAVAGNFSSFPDERDIHNDELLAEAQAQLEIHRMLTK